MDLQISVFLLFVLFTAGHSLSCYQCTDQTGSCSGQIETTCYIGYSQCTSITVVGDNELKTKDCVSACQSGSLNLGVKKLTISCCNTDLCNFQDAPDYSNILNGKKCYYCDDQSCTNTVSCTGTEDRCIKATETFGGHSDVVKGCVSKSICDAKASIPHVASISCCRGNLCNAAQSVSQSFLFLCASLLSYFLLH